MNLSSYKEEKPHHIKRIFWYLINHSLFRLLPSRYLRAPRHALLRLFGAKVDHDALIYSSCTIFAPWNLKVGRACIGPDTILYNKALISIGNDSVISQGAFLCTASHDITSVMLPLVLAPIIIEDQVWVASDAFIGKGVTLHQGSVVAARSCVVKDVASWTVVGGNPATMIKKREIIPS